MDRCGVEISSFCLGFGRTKLEIHQENSSDQISTHSIDDEDDDDVEKLSVAFTSYSLAARRNFYVYFF